MRLGWDTVPHAPHFPKLAPSGYHLFRHWSCCWSRKFPWFQQCEVGGRCILRVPPSIAVAIQWHDVEMPACRHLCSTCRHLRRHNHFHGSVCYELFRLISQSSLVPVRARAAVEQYFAFPWNSPNLPHSTNSSGKMVEIPSHIVGTAFELASKVQRKPGSSNFWISKVVQWDSSRIIMTSRCHENENESWMLCLFS